MVEETKVAELEAQREEQRLQATVRKPADAQGLPEATLAKADRDARIAAAEAARQGGRARGRGRRQPGQGRAAGAEAERVELPPPPTPST